MRRASPRSVQRWVLQFLSSPIPYHAWPWPACHFWSCLQGMINPLQAFQWVSVPTKELPLRKGPSIRKDCPAVVRAGPHGNRLCSIFMSVRSLQIILALLLYFIMLSHRDCVHLTFGGRRGARALCMSLGRLGCASCKSNCRQYQDQGHSPGLHSPP